VDDWLDTDDGAAFAITFDGVLVGSIQYAEEIGADYRHAGIDLFLDTSCRYLRAIRWGRAVLGRTALA
jgi:hypothetical protein